MAFKLLHRLGGAQAIGPILMGMSRPVQLLQQSSDVDDVVYMTAIAVVEAQELEGNRLVTDQPDRSESTLASLA